MQPVAWFRGTPIYLIPSPSGHGVGYEMRPGGAISFSHGTLAEACSKTMDSIAVDAWYRFLQWFAYDGDEQLLEADIQLLDSVWMCPGRRWNDPGVVRFMASIPGARDWPLEKHQEVADERAELGMKKIRERWPNHGRTQE